MDIKIKDEEITPKEYYKEAWHGRDFELQHLWQRSIFLGAFMLAIAAGYGAIVLKMLFPTVDDIPCDGTVTARQHVAAALICYLGITFSLLWIMMAKGSKFWFEQYEATIDHIHKKTWLGMYRENIFRNGELSLPKHINQNIFSPAAYRFSPTRINVAIGIVCLLAWSGLNMVHAGMAFRDTLKLHHATLGYRAMLYWRGNYLYCTFLYLPFGRRLKCVPKKKVAEVSF